MLALLVLSVPSLAATLTVGVSGDYATIQDAVDAASDGDSVLIDAGTFTECVDLGGKDVDLEGAGSESTTLSGGGACAVALTLGSGETASITGLSIQNAGYRAVELTNASVTLEDVTVSSSGNSADVGGGVYVDGGEVWFSGCTLSDNTGDYGANLYVTGDADVVLTGTTVSGGSATVGGGIYVEGEADAAATIELLDSTVSGNEAMLWGGGACFGEYAVATSRGVSWSDNTGGSVNGAGVYVRQYATLESNDDAFESNVSTEYTSSTTYGGALYVEGYATVSLDGGSFTANTATQGGAICSAGYADLEVNDSTFTSNTAYSYGGAIRALAYADLAIADSSFDGNQSSNGVGGAIHLDVYGALDVSGSTFSGNTSNASGGAVYLYSHSSASFADTSFDTNTVNRGAGGAIYASNDIALDITGTSFEGNKASSNGGAIYLATYSALDVSGSTFSGNAANNSGGAVYLYSHVTASFADTGFDLNAASRGAGGALLATGYITLDMVDTTFEGNRAATSGGACYLTDLYDTASLDAVLFDGNVATASQGGAIFATSSSALDITDSLFAANTSGQDGGAISTVISDLTVTNSSFEESAGRHGGAIRAYNTPTSTATLTLSGVSFEANTATGNGGAVSETGYTVDIDACVFERNDADTTAGALAIAGGGDLDLHANVFAFNSSASGGAIHAESPADRAGSAASWTNNVFIENEASTSGGAIYLYGGPTSMELANNTFVGNGAASSGGAIYLSGTTSSFVNNLFAWTSSGSAVYGGDSASAGSRFTYNDWYENSATDTAGTLRFSTSSDGNLTEAPGLVEISLDGDYENDDLTLAAGSALIDAGDPGILDPDGSISDIGAFGGPDTPTFDGDGDGSLHGEDCDDGDPSAYPGADEICDGVDDDCDGEIDEDAIDPTSWCLDEDGDGYGDPDACEASCDAPSAEHVEDDQDCDDSDPSAYPGAAETLDDGVDQDCDGVDAVDADGDGVASLDTGGDDCDDEDASAYPGADEICDGQDDDCDGEIDEDAIDAPTWYADDDGDGLGDPARAVAACDAPDGWVALGTDCDDHDATVYAGADEICDGADDDCDGETDEDAIDAPTWYADADGDGWGDAALATTACEAPAGYVGEASDCDDARADVHPGASEVCDPDHTDEDCDGLADDDDDVTGRSTWYADADADTFGDPASTQEACAQPDGYVADARDCDDGSARYHPGAEESDCEDPNDYNCDGSVGEEDADADGFVACDDCDDGEAAINADAPEICDELDNDCDGEVDADAIDAPTWYADTDNDGYTDVTAATTACEAPSGYAEASAEADCDDQDPTVSPAAAEIPDDGIDQDCDGADDGGPADTADTGDAKPTGCAGCASGGRAGGVWPWLAAGLTLILRRRAARSAPR